MKHFVSDLLTAYSHQGLRPPSWACAFPPSVPFVGRTYGTWGGLLVYGSSENLAQYVGGRRDVPSYLRDHQAGNRHRAALESVSDGFFPFVHMAPFDNGSLLVATWYYLWRTGAQPPDEPRQLVESMAAANFCKFSIQSETNEDHAEDSGKVGVSLPYVLEDLRILEPATVILPRTIWKHSEVKRALPRVAPRTRFIALPQFNAGVVNRSLAKHDDRAQVLAARMEDTALASWVDRLKGYGGGRPYRFLVEIDDVLAS